MKNKFTTLSKCPVFNSPTDHYDKLDRVHFTLHKEFDHGEYRESLTCNHCHLIINQVYDYRGWEVEDQSGNMLEQHYDD